MKTIHALFVAIITPLIASPVEWSDELRAIESQQIKLWRDKLESVRDKAPPEQLNALWLGLGNMGYRRDNYDRRSIEVDRIYDDIQSTLLSIPGHARYFADQVVNSRKESKDFTTDIEYYRVCETLLKTLPHLPSPETVWVLGEMLESDADIPTREEIIEALRRADHGGHIWHYPAGMATLTFQELEIRNRPSGSGPNGTYISEKDLVLLRAWWEKIKSGETTFSFKGQAVEYRFKPDGTWDTIPIANPPDDGPKPVAAGASERPLKRPSPSLQASQDSPHGVQWWWYAAGGSALFSLGIWFFRKSRTA